MSYLGFRYDCTEVFGDVRRLFGDLRRPFGDLRRLFGDLRRPFGDVDRTKIQPDTSQKSAIEKRAADNCRPPEREQPDFSTSLETATTARTTATCRRRRRSCDHPTGRGQGMNGSIRPFFRRPPFPFRQFFFKFRREK